MQNFAYGEIDVKAFLLFPSQKYGLGLGELATQQADKLICNIYRDLSFMTSAPFSDFLNPPALVCIFTQPPFLSFLTNSDLRQT